MTERSCTIDPCDKAEFARGWCHMHWNRWRRHGDPMYVKRIFNDLPARLVKFAPPGPPDECWLWTGKIEYTGYARMGIRGRSLYVHRVAYEVANGPIPEGYDVDHECHNRDKACPGGPCSHRRCVNPSHLVARTHKENVRRGRRFDG